MTKKVIEALLYIQGDRGLSPTQLKVALEISAPDARKELKKFAKEWNDDSNHGVFVVEFHDIFKFATQPELKDFIQKVVTQEIKQKLSQASIETAGIIAYKQPITKSQINEIRGVSSESVVNTLLVKGLVEEKGIAQTPGLPVLYGITDKFYDYFQIKSLKELPKLSEFDESEGTEEIDLYSSQRQDN